MCSTLKPYYFYPKAGQAMETRVTDPIDLLVNKLSLQPIMDHLKIDKECMYDLAVRNQMEPVEENSFDNLLIRGYFDNTIEGSSYGYNCNRKLNQPKVDNIWSIKRYQDEVQYRELGYHIQEYSSTLLWHGTCAENVVSILNNGLRKDPKKPNLFSYGPAIYFADRAINSLYYCQRGSTGKISRSPEYMFLCEVATGNILEVSQRQSFNDTPEGYGCVKALGGCQPDPNGGSLWNDILVPWGEAKYQKTETGLTYNEYMVYSLDRILIRFLVQFSRIN